MTYLDPENPDPLALARNQRLLTAASCIMIIAAGGVMAPFTTLVALKMGASPFYVGGLAAVHLGSLALQLLVVRQIQLHGKKRVLIRWHVLRPDPLYVLDRF